MNLREIISRHNNETYDCPVLLRLSPGLSVVRVELFTVRWVNVVSPLPVRNTVPMELFPVRTKRTGTSSSPSYFLMSPVVILCLYHLVRQFITSCCSLFSITSGYWMFLKKASKSHHWHTEKQGLVWAACSRTCLLWWVDESKWVTCSVFGHRAALLNLEGEESISYPKHVSFRQCG